MGVCHVNKNTKILETICKDDRKKIEDEHSIQPMESKKNIDEIYDDEINFEKPNEEFLSEDQSPYKVLYSIKKHPVYQLFYNTKSIIDQKSKISLNFNFDLNLCSPCFSPNEKRNNFILNFPSFEDSRVEIIEKIEINSNFDFEEEIQTTVYKAFDRQLNSFVLLHFFFPPASRPNFSKKQILSFERLKKNLDELSYLKSSPNLKKVYGLYRDFGRKEDEIVQGKKKGGEEDGKATRKPEGKEQFKEAEEGRTKESGSKERERELEKVLERNKGNDEKMEGGREVIVMESEIEAGDCRDVRVKKGRYTAEEIVHIMSRIAEGCLSLYSIGLCHGFIRPESIKLFEDKSRQISYKLGNFDYLEKNDGLKTNSYPKFFSQLQKKILTIGNKDPNLIQKKEEGSNDFELIEMNNKENENQDSLNRKSITDSIIDTEQCKNLKNSLIKLKKVENSSITDKKVSNEQEKEFRDKKRRKSKKKSGESHELNNPPKQNKLTNKKKRTSSERHRKSEKLQLIEKNSENSELPLSFILPQKKDQDAFNANLQSYIKFLPASKSTVVPSSLSKYLFSPPELALPPPYNPTAIEIYDFGITLLLLIGVSESDIFEIKNNLDCLDSVIGSEYQEIYGILKGVLEEDPDKRMGMAEVLEVLKGLPQKAPSNDLKYLDKENVSGSKMENPEFIKQQLKQFNLFFFLNKTNKATQIAEEIHKMVKKIGEKSLPQDLLGEYYNSMGLLCYSQGHLQEAQFYYNLSLSSFPSSCQTLRMANCLSNMGLLYKDLGELDKAEEYLEKAVNINVEVGGRESGGTAIAINNLGGFYKEIGKYGKAENLFLQSYSIITRLYGSPHEDLVLIQMNLSSLYEAESNFEQAVKSLRKAIELSEELKSNENIPFCYSSLGRIYFKSKNYTESKEAYQASLKLFDCPEFSMEEKLTPKIGLAQTLLENLELNEALLCLTTEADKQELTSLKSEALFFLGTYYMKIKNYRSAISSLTEAREISCNTQSTCTILQNLGQIHQKIGEMELAEKDYMELMDLETKKSSVYSLQVFNISLLLSKFYLISVNKPVLSLRYALQAHQIASRLCLAGPLFETCLGALGLAYKANEKFKDAIYYYEELLGLKMQEKSSSPRALKSISIAEIFYYLGNLHFLNQALPQAQEYLSRSLEMLEELGLLNNGTINAPFSGALTGLNGPLLGTFHPSSNTTISLSIQPSNRNSSTSTSLSNPSLPEKLNPSTLKDPLLSNELICNILNVLGSIESSKNMFISAEEYYIRALELASRKKLKLELLRLSMRNLGNLYEKSGEEGKLKMLIQSSKEYLARNGRESGDQTSVLNSSAFL